MYQLLKVDDIFLEAEHLPIVETPDPLSAISFCSVALHKKDVAAIGAILEALVFHWYKTLNKHPRHAGKFMELAE